MSKEAVAKVVQRAISDGGFRRQLSSDPTSALKGFDLSVHGALTRELTRRALGDLRGDPTPSSPHPVREPA